MGSKADRAHIGIAGLAAVVLAAGLFMAPYSASADDGWVSDDQTYVQPAPIWVTVNYYDADAGAVTKSLSLEVDANATVADAKARIAAQDEAAPVAGQRLSFNGVVLDNGQTPASAGIWGGAVLTLEVLPICTVTFDSNGGSYVPAQTILVGGCAYYPENPVLEGSTFEGWYTDSGCWTPFNFDTSLQEGITLYAKWSWGAAQADVHVHHLVYVPEVPATCTADGLAGYYQCDECWALFADEAGYEWLADLSSLTIPATGHEWSAWTASDDPAAAAEGEKVRTCAVCGEVETKVARTAESVPAQASGQGGEMSAQAEDASAETSAQSSSSPATAASSQEDEGASGMNAASSGANAVPTATSNPVNGANAKSSSTAGSSASKIIPRRYNTNLMPATGDALDSSFYAAALLASAAGIALIASTQKRRRLQ